MTWFLVFSSSISIMNKILWLQRWAIIVISATYSCESRLCYYQNLIKFQWRANTWFLPYFFLSQLIYQLHEYNQCLGQGIHCLTLAKCCITTATSYMKIHRLLISDPPFSEKQKCEWCLFVAINLWPNLITHTLKTSHLYGGWLD